MIDSLFLTLMFVLTPQHATELTYHFKGPVFDCDGELHHYDFKISSWIDREGYVWIGEKGNFLDSSFVWYGECGGGHTPGGAFGSKDEGKAHLDWITYSLFKRWEDHHEKKPPILWFRIKVWRTGIREES